MKILFLKILFFFFFLSWAIYQNQKGSGTSFWCTFSIWFFKKNALYLILYRQLLTQQTTWNHPKTSETIRNHLKPSETTWNHPKLPETICNHPKFFATNQKVPRISYNIFHITYFTPFSSVSIVDFEQVHSSWVFTEKILVRSVTLWSTCN